MIHRLKVNEEWVEEEADIRKHVEDFYRDLYTEDWGIRPRVDGLPFPSISEE